MTLAIAINHPRFFLTNRLQLALGARAAGYRVVVICPMAEECAEIQALGFEVETVHIKRKSISPISELRSLFSFVRALRKVRPDIFHGFTVKCLLYGVAAARITGVPKIIGTVTGLGTVFLMKGPLGGFLRFAIGVMYRMVCRGDVRIVFQNADDQRYFNSHGWVESERSYLVHGTGVNLNDFRPLSFPETAVTNILFPSRLLIDKGVRELIRACESLQSEGYSFRLQICGWLDEGSRSTLNPSDLEIIQRLPFIDWLGLRKDMPQVFAGAHIVCLPSYREGMPLVLMEACACGRPIVATDVPGCREVVKHNINGILVEPRDSLSLAAALKMLLVSPDLRRSMGANGRKAAEENFGSPKILQQMFDVYNSGVRHQELMTEKAG